jgi:hypothetical protein
VPSAPSTDSLLRHTRYLWLRNPRNLTDHQADRLAELLRLPLTTGRAYRWMLRFDGVYEIEDPDEAAAYLRRWQRGAVRSRPGPIIDFAHLVREYWLGIVRWWHSKISKGLLEGLHSLVQAAKCRARGYRSIRNYLAHDPPHRRQARCRRHPHEVARSQTQPAPRQPRNHLRLPARHRQRPRSSTPSTPAAYHDPRKRRAPDDAVVTSVVARQPSRPLAAWAQARESGTRATVLGVDDIQPRSRVVSCLLHA